MKIFLCLFVFLFAVLGHAEEKPYFSYGDVHAMGGYPMVGIGFRAQKDVHAFDLSANACPWNPPRSLTVFHFRALYLIYPAKEGLYFGAGLGFLNEPETMKRMSGSFEGAIGWQGKLGRRARIFLEVDGIVPFHKAYAASPQGIQLMSRIWPGLTTGFGF